MCLESQSTVVGQVASGQRVRQRHASTKERGGHGRESLVDGGDTMGDVIYCLQEVVRLRRYVAGVRGGKALVS
jgi:hypothetical protein